VANVEKLEAVMDYIRNHPEEHNQSSWAERGSCGTTLCFAGTTVALAGYAIMWDALTNDAHLCRAPKNAFRNEYISEVAANELELSDAQARSLFLNALTFDDVERTVKDIINEQTP
jgi:hypothetical protein